MAQPLPVESLVRRVARQVRLRRAEHGAVRGAFWGATAAAVVLVFKGPLGDGAVAAAGGLVLGGVLFGIAWGVTRRVGAGEAARVADRAFGLQDRVPTVLEWADRPERTPLVDALVADTLARLEVLVPRQIVRRIVPRETRWLPVSMLTALALLLAPPVPMPSGGLPGLLGPRAEEEREERADASLLEERSRPLSKDALKRAMVEERDFAERAGGGGAAASGDLAAIFKDTALSGHRPDFNSFLKKGDERLKLLAQADRLPDLQSDFTNTTYKVMFRKSKALTAGLRPDQISPQKLRELLEEMQRLGRKGGSVSGDAEEGMEALEGGQTDKALEAMQRALDKIREMDEARRSGKGLRGGRERDRSARGRGAGEGGEEEDFGEMAGLLPGRGRSPTPKGEATARLRATPYDVGVEGESRQGRKDGYDTNLTGRGAAAGSRLHYLGVVGQYRKLMEDAITREQVPREYHDQIKDYFQALDER